MDKKTNDKITIKDIESIKFENILKKKIKKQYHSIEDFCTNKDGSRWMSPDTVRKNLRKDKTSKKFRVLACNKLGIVGQQIIIEIKQELIDMVKKVVRNIHDYRDDKKLLACLKKKCKEYHLDNEAMKIIQEEIKCQLVDLRDRVKDNDCHEINAETCEILEKAVKSLEKNSYQNLVEVQSLLTQVVDKMNKCIRRINKTQEYAIQSLSTVTGIIQVIDNV